MGLHECEEKKKQDTNMSMEIEVNGDTEICIEDGYSEFLTLCTYYTFYHCPFCGKVLKEKS